MIADHRAVLIFVIGAEVTKGQAMATGRRLEALVEAFDVHPIVEEVQSLAAKLVKVQLNEETAAA